MLCLSHEAPKCVQVLTIDLLDISSPIGVMAQPQPSSILEQLSLILYFESIPFYANLNPQFRCLDH